MFPLPSISSNTNNNMGIEMSSQNLNHLTEVQVCEPKAKRTKSPGIRMVGSRIHDSANGKTCHQCRQKKMNLAASCKNLKAGKPCVIKFCHKCLLNRYGEKAAEVELLSNWRCPKCRGECNCSCCRKRQGLVPTGPLVHTAKASGFKSVADMLQNVNNVADSPMEEATMERAEEAQRLRKREKAEAQRLLDMQRRQKERIEELRVTQKKDEEFMNVKEQLRAEIQSGLNKLEMQCRDMASLLRGLGIHVGGGFKNPSPDEVRVAYKRALLKFHPDRTSKTDIREQVEGEEKFKLISRMKTGFR